jgi:hypothetical protein
MGDSFTINPARKNIARKLSQTRLIEPLIAAALSAEFYAACHKERPIGTTLPRWNLLAT